MGGPVSAKGPLQIVGQIGGEVRAVAAAGSTLYAGVGTSLITLDVSSPATPRAIGTLTPFADEVQDLTLAGNVAYLAMASVGLAVVGLSDPTRPTFLGAYDTPGFARGVAAAGSFVYVADGPGGLRVVDIRDPTTPREVGTAADFDDVLAVVVQGPYAYLAAAGAGLVVVDVRDATRPAVVGRLATVGFAYGVAVSGTTAYLADGWAGVRVVDVGDPAEPREVGSVIPAGWAADVKVVGSHAYVAAMFGGLRVLDLANPAAPTETGSVTAAGGHAAKVAVGTGTAYVADTRLGVHVVNVTDASMPIRVGLYSPVGFGDGIAVSGHTGYVAAGTYGFRVVDLSVPTSPREIGSFATPDSMTVSVAGDFAYVETGRKLHVLDVSNPGQIVADYYQYEFGTTRNSVTSGTLLADANEWGLRLTDIAQPAALCEFSFMNFQNSGREGGVLGGPGASGVAIGGAVAYVASAQGGLWVIDISDVRHPALAATFAAPAPGQGGVSFEDLVFRNGLVYAIDRTHPGGYLRIIDVSNSRRPQGVSSLALPQVGQGWGPFLALGGTTLYVAAGRAGLLAIDVSDPAAPRLTQSLRLPAAASASAVAVDDVNVYVAAEDAGVLVMRVGATRAASPHAYAVVDAPPYGATTLRLQELEPSAPRASVASAAVAQDASCTVTSADDSGAGTLRACLGTFGRGTRITFYPAVFPPQSPARIVVRSPLPELAGGVTLDASDAGVVLDGGRAPTGTSGLVVRSDGNVIEGLQILGFPQEGILLEGSQNLIGGDRARGRGPTGEGNVLSGNGGSGICVCGSATGNRIVGNHVGLDAPSRALLTNGVYGVIIQANGNTLGGPSAADRNVIAGTGRSDVEVNGARNLIQGNYIGTDATGTVLLSNPSNWQVAIEGGSPNNRVERNVIAGKNSHAGIVLYDSGTSYNQVLGNFLGLDRSGAVALGTALILSGAPFNRIGGSLVSERNVINGGLLLSGDDSLVIGNYLGTDASGTRKLGPGGVFIESRRNIIGGAGPGEGNVVTGGRAISLNPGADSNVIAGNTLGGDASGSIAFGGGWLQISGANSNVVQRNRMASSDTDGITLDQGASWNWIRANTVAASNGPGINVASGSGNVMAGNVLRNNRNAYDAGQATRWDDGGRGNYWSDYRGVDANADGIGDSAYPIAPNGADRFPLMTSPIVAGPAQ